MMKKLSIGALLVALAVTMAGPAQAAFTVGGENGWSLGTDGIVNIFAAYQTQNGSNDAQGVLGSNAEQKFGVRVGLLPSIIAFNVKAPTTAGIDSTVRVAFYPNVQNTSSTRFNTSPNIDNREFFYTASGSFGSFLAGRALNLFQGQNILNDMTLFTAGVVDMTAVPGGTSLGHIGYGYLYTNFGPQFRYTTPDFGGFKVALEIGEPYAITPESAKQNIPRFEAEFSYAKTLSNGSIHAWLEGLWQQDTRSLRTTTAASLNANGTTNIATNVATPRGGGHNTSLGIAPGINVQIGPVGLMGSGYYGQGLGMISAQDGALGLALGDGRSTADRFGNTRRNWGYLAQATFQVAPAVRLAVNYGACRSDKTDAETGTEGLGNMKSHEALVGQVNYNLNKFTQFTLEYIWAQNVLQGGDKLRSNQFALGTVFFW